VEPILKCRKFEVFRRQIAGSDGGRRPYEVIVHPGAVVVLPLLDHGASLVLTRNYRYTIEQELWELPAGTLDKPGEDPVQAAHRELEEETGYRAGRLDPLVEFYPSPGISTELIRAYVAADLKKARQRLEPTERITVEIVGFNEAMGMIRKGHIVDAKTIITLLRWDLEQRHRQ
jgi:ADP-ribose pyrophosphatase